jgi:hypothetical protein
MDKGRKKRTFPHFLLDFFLKKKNGGVGAKAIRASEQAIELERKGIFVLKKGKVELYLKSLMRKSRSAKVTSLRPQMKITTPDVYRFSPIV